MEAHLQVSKGKVLRMVEDWEWVLQNFEDWSRLRKNNLRCVTYYKITYNQTVKTYLYSFEWTSRDGVLLIQIHYFIYT